VPGVPVLVKSGHRVMTLWPDFTRTGTPGTHTHKTDDNDIRPRTVQEHNERTSMEFNLVMAQSTAHEPPEDGRIYIWTETCRGKFFKIFLSVLSIKAN